VLTHAISGWSTLIKRRYHRPTKCVWLKFLGSFSGRFTGTLNFPQYGGSPAEQPKWFAGVRAAGPRHLEPERVTQLANTDSSGWLADAVRRAYASAATVGSSMLVVDAINDRVAAFYEGHGFARLPDSLRLMTTRITAS